MSRRVLALLLAVAAAGVLHTLAARHLAALDPIGALIERRDAGVVAAAIGVAVARLFLFFVAPGWAVAVVVSAAARRAAYEPPK